jgi:hypothetical protein
VTEISIIKTGLWNGSLIEMSSSQIYRKPKLLLNEQRLCNKPNFEKPIYFATCAAKCDERWLYGDQLYGSIASQTSS